MDAAMHMRWDGWNVMSYQKSYLYFKMPPLETEVIGGRSKVELLHLFPINISVYSYLYSIFHSYLIRLRLPQPNSQWNAIRFDDDDSFICTIFFIYLNFTYSFSLLQFTWIFCLGNIKIFSSIWQNCLCFSLMSMKNAEEHLLNNLFISFHS